MEGEQHLLKRTETKHSATSANSSAEDYQKLLDSYTAPASLKEGDLLKGRVLKITENEVIVDVGYKCEGLIPARQVRDRHGNKHRPGRRPGGRNRGRSGRARGLHPSLSREKAERIKVWEAIERAYQQQTPLPGRVIDRIKGGLSVDIGARAFLPGSQVDMRPVRNLDGLKGQEIQVKVIKLNRKRGNIVVSRKLVLEEENTVRKERTLNALFEGAVVRGVVKNITDYGVFIDLGGIDGLLHVTDLSWGRVNHASEILQANDEVDVVVLKFDRDKERVSLGLKQLYEDPWANVGQKFPVGYRVRGRVVSITDYGAFVELEPGVEGLIHISEMTWSKRLKHPSKIVSVGDMVEADILDVHSAERRISLSLRQTEPNPGRRWLRATRWATGSRAGSAT